MPGKSILNLRRDRLADSLAAMSDFLISEQRSITEILPPVFSHLNVTRMIQTYLADVLDASRCYDNAVIDHFWTSQPTAHKQQETKGK